MSHTNRAICIAPPPVAHIAILVFSVLLPACRALPPMMADWSLCIASHTWPSLM